MAYIGVGFISLVTQRLYVSDDDGGQDGVAAHLLVPCRYSTLLSSLSDPQVRRHVPDRSPHQCRRTKLYKVGHVVSDRSIFGDGRRGKLKCLALTADQADYHAANHYTLHSRGHSSKSVTYTQRKTDKKAF